MRLSAVVFLDQVDRIRTPFAARKFNGISRFGPTPCRLCVGCVLKTGARETGSAIGLIADFCVRAILPSVRPSRRAQHADELEKSHSPRPALSPSRGCVFSPTGSPLCSILISFYLPLACSVHVSFCLPRARPPCLPGKRLLCSVFVLFRTKIRLV